MGKERKGRFANPTIVLADGMAAAAYGPWIDSLLVSLVDEGLNPILVTPGETALAEQIPDRAIARLACPAARWALLRRWGSRWLLGRLGDEPVRLVLAMTGREARYGAWLAEALNVPLAVVVMGEAEIAPVVAVGDRLAAAFAGSKALADALKGRLGAAREARVRQVALGVHLGPRVTEFGDPLRVWGFMAAGPLEPGQGFDQVIGAFAALREKGYTAVYFIVGSGSGERELRRLAERKGLNADLSFVPDQRGLETFFDGIDVFIQPFVCRQLDLRLLEAMAAGMVVLARNGGALDIVEDGVNGVALSRGGEAELTLLLGRLMDEPDLGRRLGASARQFVQANHLAGVTVQPVIERVKQIALSQQTLHIPAPAQ